jgi:hypothetical protein
MIVPVKVRLPSTILTREAVVPLIWT